jgi:uncharacterized protein
MTDERKLKIVVFGAFGAGKTTLIKTLDPDSKHIEANCAGGTTTVALDFGRVQLNGCHIHVYGTPGQERFEFAREIIARGMDGAILLVDASSPPDEFTEHLSESLHGANVPFVVFLNKCDCAGADPDRFAGKFGQALVTKVSAKDKRQCLDALGSFVGTLPVRANGHNSYHK